MEWSYLVRVLSTIVLSLLLANDSANGTMTKLASTSKAVSDIPPTPCIQNIRGKIAMCDHMNLKRVPSNLNEDITYLNLAQNEIKSLYNNSFSRYRLLKVLNLFSNGIELIELGAFYPLQHLTMLILQNNNVQITDSRIFRKSERLDLLLIGSPSLSYFPNDTLRWLPKLSRLGLSGSSLSFINITHCPMNKMCRVALDHTKLYSLTAGTFSFSCKLHFLELDGINFVRVDPVVFRTLGLFQLTVGLPDKDYSMQAYFDLFTGISQSSLEMLSLYAYIGNIFTIPLDFFAPLGAKNVLNMTLTLSGLSLRLQDFAFRNLTYVNVLHIFRTGIEIIHPEYFYGMFGLHVLDLSRNSIYGFNTFSSKWNVDDLLYLNLSRNRIQVLSKNAFLGLKNLLTLDLSDNPCHLVHSLSLLNLQLLDVSRSEQLSIVNFYLPNLFTFLLSERKNAEFWSFFQLNIFWNSSSLEQILLDNSHMSLRDIWSVGFHKSIFHGLRNVTFIDLSNNYLFTLPSGLFQTLSSLAYLNLGHCKISVIEPNVFHGVDALEILYLDHNLLSTVHFLFPVNMMHLLILTLDSNLLDWLDKGLFSNVPNISFLNISENRLTVLNQSTFIPIQSALKVIDLSGNPLQCSCQIKWLTKWSTKPSILIARANQTVCSFTSGVHFRGQSLFMIDPKDLCTSYTPLYCMLPFMAVALFGVVSVVYSKRWFLKYKMFLLRLAIVGYQEIQDPRDHGNYDFDLNVIFTDDDKEWVTENFLPQINEHLPHYDRIAYRDDDLPLGMYYLDAVLYLIEHSFKTVLLLSRAATRDHDFMMRLRTALNHVTNTRTLSTLLVFLENIGDEELPHLVKLYLSEERPYMRWIEDERAQKYFWKKLIKTLKVNLKCNDMIPPE